MRNHKVRYGMATLLAAGQPLFVLDAVELSNALRVAQNSVRQTAAKYATNRDEYQRYELLYEKGAYSRQQLESARTKMLASEADYDSAQANLGSAQKQVDEAAVVSPVSGVMLTRNQHPPSGLCDSCPRGADPHGWRELRQDECR